jgi:hypothetical protein
MLASQMLATNWILQNIDCNSVIFSMQLLTPEEWTAQENMDKETAIGHSRYSISQLAFPFGYLLA